MSMVFHDWWARHRRDVFFMLFVLAVAGTARLTGLGTFLTADEKTWLIRSHDFVEAFGDGRFNDMLQTTHPGVTTLWVTGLSITLQEMVSGIPFTEDLLIHFVKTSQLAVAFLNTLLIGLGFGLMRVLMETVRKRTPLSDWIAYGFPLSAALLMAVDPFLVGYSRVVHVDAVLAGFMFAAALATVLYGLTGFSRAWLVISALLSALALLTKIPAVFLVPFWGLVVLVFQGKNLWQGGYWRDRLWDLTVWLSLIVLTAVVVWPALFWVPNPKGNIELVQRDVSIAAVTPHHMAEDYTLNGSHYLYTLLTRTSPVLLIFSLIGFIQFSIIKAQFSKKSQFSMIHYRLAFLLIAYVFFFVLMMTLGAKKGDRYILPVWPALAVLATVGIFQVGSWLENCRRPSVALAKLGKLRASYIIAGFVFVYLAVILVRYHPYTIAYSNPLFPDNLSQELGWGEGLDKVGAWINETNSNAVVASWYPDELQAFTEAPVIHISGHERPQVRYVVLYRNMFGRAEDHPATAYLRDYISKREPVHVIEVAGKEYAWVFERPAYERVVEPLRPGSRVRQELEVGHDGFRALDVLVATYNGEARSGELVVEMRRDPQGAPVAVWERPIAGLGDDEWLTLSLPETLRLARGEEVFVDVYTRGIGTDDRAPTVRFTRDYADGASFLSITDGRPVRKDGRLAVRLRYWKDGVLLTEEDVLLL